MKIHKNNIKNWVFLILCLLCFSPAAKADFKKTKIAVLDFEIHGDQKKTADMGGVAAEWFTTTMVKSGRFDVIERAMLQKILDEQKLGMMGVVDESSASQIGKVLGVENIITGSLLIFAGSVEVNARIIDVESGSIVAAENITGTAKANLQQLVDELTQRIVYHFPMTGYVVKRDDKKIIIDLGMSAGLNIGMEFVVFKEGEILKHPKTGEILDVEQIHTGRIKITNIRNNVSEAIIISEQPEGISTGQMVKAVQKRPEMRDKAVTVKEVTGSLIVDTTPPDAKIRLLNISPQYSPGMKLNAGKYHVEVSKPDYRTITQWVTITAGKKSVVPISLQPIPRAAGGKKKLSVLPASFSPESKRNYPTWITLMESKGYGNAIWQELEDILYDSDKFELLLEPPNHSELFKQILSGRAGQQENEISIELPERILTINVNFFIKKSASLSGMSVSNKEMFHSTVYLRYYDLTGVSINRALPATGDAIDEDLINATRLATRNATQKLLRRLGK